jgi:lipopolysaccharide/colanic/teichoic acid biosynthesis glycosyltransferase
MKKRLFDLTVSLIILIIALPIYFIVACMIYIEDRGDVFFFQKRIGKNGVVFNLIKFRSMVSGAEASGTGLYSYQGDSRITKVGQFIRKTSLDELPQVFNVIRGEMSIVGPRPPVTYELGPWDEYTSEMLKRFTVNPGITGLAQISGRNENDWDLKIKFDNEYIDLWQEKGVVIDLKILLKTLVVVIVGGDTIESATKDEGAISRKARVAAEEYIQRRK